MKSAIWTTDRLESVLSEICGSLGINNRYPTDREIEKYYGRKSVTARKLKWYIDKRLPDTVYSETGFGSMGEGTAESILIAKGYQVDRMPIRHPFDLLVAKSVKVEVKSSRPLTDKYGHTYFSFNLGKAYSPADVYMLMCFSDEPVEVYIIPSHMIQTNISVSILPNGKYKEYKDKFNYIDQYIDFMKTVR